MKTLSSFAFLFALWLGSNAHAHSCTTDDTQTGTCYCSAETPYDVDTQFSDQTCQDCYKRKGCYSPQWRPAKS